MKFKKCKEYERRGGSFVPKEDGGLGFREDQPIYYTIWFASASEINQSAAQREYNAPVIGKNVCTPECKVNDESLVVNKINFVAFICHTINVAAQLKKKSDRIKTIVEAAGQFLDVRY